MREKNTITTIIVLCLLMILPDFFIFEIRPTFDFGLFVAYIVISMGITIVANKFVFSYAKNHESVFTLRLKIYDIFKKRENNLLNIQEIIERNIKKEYMERIQQALWGLKVSEFYNFEKEVLRQEIENGTLKQKVKKVPGKRKEKQYIYKLLKNYNAPFAIRDIRVDYETKTLIERSNKGAWGILATVIGLVLSVMGFIGWQVFSGATTGGVIIVIIMAVVFLISDIESYIHARRFYIGYYKYYLEKIEETIKEIEEKGSI